VNVDIKQTVGTEIDKDLAFDIQLTNVDYECMLFLEQMIYFYTEGHKVIRDTKNWGPVPEIELDKLKFASDIAKKIIEVDNQL